MLVFYFAFGHDETRLNYQPRTNWPFDCNFHDCKLLEPSLSFSFPEKSGRTFTLPKTHRLLLKIRMVASWKMKNPFWISAYFQG